MSIWSKNVAISHSLDTDDNNHQWHQCFSKVQQVFKKQLMADLSLGMKLSHKHQQTCLNLTTVCHHVPQVAAKPKYEAHCVLCVYITQLTALRHTDPEIRQQTVMSVYIHPRLRLWCESEPSYSHSSTRRLFWCHLNGPLSGHILSYNVLLKD